MTKFQKTASTLIKGSKTVPGEYYTSQKIFALECDRIFATLYHAWTYGLDGQLMVVPLMNELEDFCREEYLLHGVNVITWEGFIF